MKRLVVAGTLGLALVGCAQDRSAVSPPNPTTGPVGLSTYPSIHDSVNMDNKNVDPSTLPSNAPWRDSRYGPRMAANNQPQPTMAAQAPARPVAPSPVASAPAAQPAPAPTGMIAEAPAAAASEIALQPEQAQQAAPAASATGAVAAAPGGDPLPDPSVGATPDAVPVAAEAAASPTQAPAVAASPGSEALPDPTAGQPAATASEAPAPPAEPAAAVASTPDAGSLPDPSVGATPDAVPTAMPPASTPENVAAPTAQPDPAIGASPDAVPAGLAPGAGGAVDPASVPLPEPAAPAAPADAPPVGAPAEPAAATAAPAALPDPSVGATPDAVPDLGAAPTASAPAPLPDPAGAPTLDAATPAALPDPTAGAAPAALPDPTAAPAPPADAAAPPMPAGDLAPLEAPPLPPDVQGVAPAPASAGTAAAPAATPLPAAAGAGQKPATTPAPKAGQPTGTTPGSAKPAAPAASPSPTPAATAPAPQPPAAGPGAEKAGAPATPADTPLPELPPLPVSQTGAGASPSTAVTSGPAPTAGRGNLDPEVRTASNDPTTFRSELHSPKIVNAGEFAAVVGDEVITLHELTMAVRDKLKNVPANQRPSTRQHIDMLGAAVLAELMRESILYQEAKRELKNPKQLQMFMDFAEKVWNEDELPPMMKKAACVNEYELKKKLEEEGTSLNKIHENFRRNFLAHSFVKNKLGAKMTVSLPEMRDYYNAHLKDYEQPALVTWREIVVEVDKNGGPAPAKRKADAILARLLRGEDFAKVCKADSDGPELSKSQGGLWKTSPGSYGVEAVNQALDALEIGKLSRVIEGPSSLHIVRVEGRRAAGPTSFADVGLQDEIREKVYKEKVDRITNAFIEKIRSETPIRTMFDGTSSDPKLARRMTHN